jgi:molybdopterin-guanine dinucleotide biosynthesis protein A
VQEKSRLNTEFIIMAAGDGTRFNSDTPKHLIEIGGEKVLERTIRLLLGEGASRVQVIVPPNNPDYMVAQDSRLNFIERKKPVDTNMDKFFEAFLVATPNMNSVIIWGDVFFTRPAVIEIISQSLTLNETKFFSRFGSNPLINAPWGEIFAAFVPANQRDHFLKSAQKVKSLYLENAIWRDGTWELAKFLSNKSIKDRYLSHPKLAIYHEIKGMSDDIDFQEDAARFRAIVPDTPDEIKERYIQLVGEVADLYMKLSPFSDGKNRPNHASVINGNGELENFQQPVWHLRRRIEKIPFVRLYNSAAISSVVNSFRVVRYYFERKIPFVRLYNSRAGRLASKTLRSIRQYFESFVKKIPRNPR